MRLAVGIGSSALRAYVSPVPRCSTAIATLPWCAFANGASLDSREADSPQRHKGHKEETSTIENKNFFILHLPAFFVPLVPFVVNLLHSSRGPRGRPPSSPGCRSTFPASSSWRWGTYIRPSRRA